MNRYYRSISVAIMGLAVIFLADTCKQNPPEKKSSARVFFKNLKDGAEVTSPVKVEMGVEGIKVNPADGSTDASKGHHHIIINGPFLKKGEVVGKGQGEIPPDKTYPIHFGKGQTEAELKLKPGKYMLTLQFADGLHQSFGEKLSAKITITVVEKK